MKTNVGTIDRVLRVGLGIALLSLAFLSGLPAFAEPFLKYGAAIAGIVMLATSMLKLCPVYSIFGIKTCKDC
jgi:hypothetical protein